MSPTLVDADPASGFEYPYYLHAPDTDPVDSVPILVEPTNMPGPAPTLSAVRERAARRAEGGFGRRVADELGVPFLYPVFPRPVSDPVDWTHLTHSLDAETLAIEDGPLARIDEQLVAMVDHARERLADRGVPTRKRFAMNGFSAAGSFVNRFVALHPDRLVSVTAGGLNGIALLPFAELDTDRLAYPGDVAAMTGRDRLELPYHVGVADLTTLTGEPFDREAFCAVNQFLYVGGADTKDVLLWPDAFTQVEQRLAAILAYGPDIHDQRFPRCRALYDEAGADAVFRVYEGVGHEPDPAMADVVRFHGRSFAGDDAGEIGPALGGTSPG